jgi:hypothetical protein
VTTTMDPEILAALEERERRTQEIAATLPATLPPLTRIIMASDLAGLDRVRAEIASGELTPEKSLVQAGSYARIPHLLWLLDEGHITRQHALRLLPLEWPSSDPDDTDPRLLELWRDARHLKGDVVLDNPKKPLPAGAWKWIYRGQMPGDPIGFAWSLREEVAERFARGASLRVPVKGGVMIRALVARKTILAYLTDRNEDEVIVDPKTIAKKYLIREALVDDE